MSPRSHAPVVDDEPADHIEQTDDLTEPGPGRRLGRYELLRLLGSGGMANVYLARVAGPGGFEKLLAIKCIHTFLARDRRFVQMFLDEARISALVSHPNVAQVFELGEERGMYFLAMELLHGEHLGALHARALKVLGALPFEIAATVALAAAEGLHQAHETEDAEGRPLQVVHRDVSPQNVFVTYDGLVKLTDFGIAKATNRLVETDSGSVKGKFGYMAPEQALGMTVDRRTDVFALGVVLWELLTGRRLFRAATSAETLLNVTRCEVAAPSSIQPACPPELERVALRALARDPSDRFATAAELAESLSRWLRDERRTVERTQLAAFVRRLFPDRAANRPRANAASHEASLPSPEPPAASAEPSHSGVRPGATTAAGPTERLVAPEAHPPSAAALLASTAASSPPTDAIQEPSSTRATAGATDAPSASTTTAGATASSTSSAPRVASPARDDEPVVLPQRGPSAPVLIGGVTLLVAIAVAVVLVWTREPSDVPATRPRLEAVNATVPSARPQAPSARPQAPATSTAAATTPSIVGAIEPAEPAISADAPGAAEIPMAAESSTVSGTQAHNAPRAAQLDLRRRPLPASSAVTSPIPDTTERWGYLNLITTPWARVWIDGEPAGTTPLYRRRVRAGQVSIELRAEGRGPPRRTSLTVRPGETVSRRMDLSQP